MCRHGSLSHDLAASSFISCPGLGSPQPSLQFASTVTTMTSVSLRITRRQPSVGRFRWSPSWKTWVAWRGQLGGHTVCHSCSTELGQSRRLSPCPRGFGGLHPFHRACSSINTNVNWAGALAGRSSWPTLVSPRGRCNCCFACVPKSAASAQPTRL